MYKPTIVEWMAALAIAAVITLAAQTCRADTFVVCFDAREDLSGEVGDAMVEANGWDDDEGFTVIESYTSADGFSCFEVSRETHQIAAGVMLCSAYPISMDLIEKIAALNDWATWRVDPTFPRASPGQGPVHCTHLRPHVFCGRKNP